MEVTPADAKPVAASAAAAAAGTAATADTATADAAAAAADTDTADTADTAASAARGLRSKSGVGRSGVAGGEEELRGVEVAQRRLEVAAAAVVGEGREQQAAGLQVGRDEPNRDPPRIHIHVRIRCCPCCCCCC